MLLFELFNPNLELKNEVKEVLAQYTYLRYSLEEGDELQVVFSKDTDLSYVNKIMVGFKFQVVEKAPVTIKVTGRKTVDSFKDFKSKPIIGNIEKVGLPGLNLQDIEAKADTGATSSVLSCSSVKISADKKKVTFTPLHDDSPQYSGKSYTLKIEELVSIQSSNGERQMRPLVKLKLTLSGQEFETYFSLTDRSQLEYAILLGKDVLSGFLIDASLIH